MRRRPALLLLVLSSLLLAGCGGSSGKKSSSGGGKHLRVGLVTDTGQLNDRGYILPGLGDFGDRLFGTEP